MNYGLRGAITRLSVQLTRWRLVPSILWLGSMGNACYSKINRLQRVNSLCIQFLTMSHNSKPLCNSPNSCLKMTSYHFHPIFAQQIHSAIFPPSSKCNNGGYHVTGYGWSAQCVIGAFAKRIALQQWWRQSVNNKSRVFERKQMKHNEKKGGTKVWWF